MSGAPKGAASSELPGNQFAAATATVGVKSEKSMSSELCQVPQTTGLVPGISAILVTSTDVDTGLPETHWVCGKCHQFVSGENGDCPCQVTGAKAAHEVPSSSDSHRAMEEINERMSRAFQTSQKEGGMVAGELEAASHAAVTEGVNKAQEPEVASEAHKESLVSPRSTVGDGNSSGSSGDSKDLTIFVGNVPDQTKWWKLKDFFSSFGPVKFCKIPCKTGPRQKSHAFIEFTTEEGYYKALNARDDQLFYRGWLLRVEKRERWKPKQVQPAKTEPAPAAVEQLQPIILPPCMGCMRGPGVCKRCQALCDQLSPSHSPQLEEWWSPSSADCQRAQCPPDKGSEKMNELDDLSLSTIFSYLQIDDLTRFERVCKRWQALILAEWKCRASISFGGGWEHPMQLINDRVLNSILRKCGGNVKYLDLTDTSRLSKDFLDIIMKHCPRLVKIELPGMFIFSTKSAQKFAESCKHLEWLDLSRKCVSEKGLWYILHSCKKLRYLNVGWCKSISGKCFFMLGNEFKTMKLRHCEMLGDYAMDKLMEKCPDLQELDISACWSLSHAGLTRMFQGLRSLQVLDAEDYENFDTHPGDITPQTWSGIRHLTSLTALCLGNNWFLTDEVLTAVACSCTRLRELRVFNMANEEHLTDASVCNLVHLADLQLLDISGQSKVTDEGLMPIIKQCKLQKFKAVGCKLTDATGVCLAEFCPTLKFVDLRDNEQVTMKTLEAFIQQVPECGVSRPLAINLFLGGTAVPSYIREQMKLPSNIILNTVPYSVFYHGSAIPILAFEDDPDEDADNIDNVELPKVVPAGMEDYDIDDEMITFGIEDDFLENDDPVLWDYFNPS